MAVFRPLVEAKLEAVGAIPPQWYYPKEELIHSPSVQAGMSPDAEQKLLRQAASFIRSVAERINDIPHSVRLSQLSVSVAIIQMRRFFLINSLKDHDPRDIGTAALFLSAKSEECPRRLEYFILTYFRLRVEIDCPRKDWERLSCIDRKFYDSLCEYITWLENLILQTVGFDFNIDVPHPMVLTLCDYHCHGNKKFAEVAYWLATDTLHLTDWCVRYKPSFIACAIFYLVSVWSGMEIISKRDKEGKNRAWFSPVIAELDHELMFEILAEYTAITGEIKRDGSLATIQFKTSAFNILNGTRSTSR